MGAEQEEHLQEIVAGFSTGMLVTRTAGGGMHARPLAVAADPQRKQGGPIYFATSIESPKVAEIEAEPNVLVTFQGKARWAVVAGTAEVVRDRSLIDRLWSDDWRIFFPDGPGDKYLCILAIRPSAGEYWDDRGAAGARSSARGAVARAAGRRLETDEAHDHAKLQPGKPRR
jgi:general stress protein 26